VISIIGGALAPLTIFFALLLLAAFAVEAWALIDAISRPTAAFLAAGKQTKQIWLIILGVASAVGLAMAFYGGITSILAVAAFAAAAIYHVDVRPKIREFRKGRGSSNGPYGPW
jgi:hypothetical protein